MANTSATSGYLTPAAQPAPRGDDALDNFLHDVFVGLTGMDGALVRPLWEEEPANEPAREVTWMAFGVVRFDPDTYAVELHNPEGDGTDELQRHETLEIQLSAYGPLSWEKLAQLRDGLQIEQNRAVLSANAMGLTNSTEIRKAPVLVKDKWRKRFDMSIIMRRQIRREYAVLNLLSAKGILDTEATQTSLDVTGS